MSDEKERTGRGLRVYGRFNHEHGGDVLEVRVQESSLAERACCWLFVHGIACDHLGEVTHHVAAGAIAKGDVGLHLTVPEARKAIAALQAFVEENSHHEDMP